MTAHTAHRPKYQKTISNETKYTPYRCVPPWSSRPENIIKAKKRHASTILLLELHLTRNYMTAHTAHRPKYQKTLSN